MRDSEPFHLVPEKLAEALRLRGFSALTPVQRAVLEPGSVGRDLRVSSQTGSGKTVAIGFALARELAEADPSAPSPSVLVVAPTRELAAQVGRELGWLLEPLGAAVAVVTGGTNPALERRALAGKPRVVVGTPGRLVDHMTRGALSPHGVRALVLDEADQMLDLGFKDELDAIVGRLPTDRRTHLVSATFPREVQALADKFQRNPLAIEGTRPGAGNDDITHVAHLVHQDQRLAALINLLLVAPDERTLVFVRTRADASELVDRLVGEGFAARALSGDLEQDERTRTLEAFRAGHATVLVATDVAARGLDVADVGRVVHADPPGDAEMLTHRSGRTGRAGRKGASHVLVTPIGRDRVARLYARARLQVAWRPAPSREDVLAAAEARLAAELNNDTPVDASAEAFAERLLAHADARILLARAITKLREPVDGRAREVTRLALPEPSRAGSADHGTRRGPPPRVLAPYARTAGPPRGPEGHAARPAPRDDGPAAPRAEGYVARPPSGEPKPTDFTLFQVSWGAQHGADPRRLLALACRRGGVDKSEIGAIRIGDTSSTLEIATRSSHAFGAKALEPDARDPRVKFRPVTGVAPAKRPGPPTRRIIPSGQK